LPIHPAAENFRRRFFCFTGQISCERSGVSAERRKLPWKFQMAACSRKPLRRNGNSFPEFILRWTIGTSGILGLVYQAGVAASQQSAAIFYPVSGGLPTRRYACLVRSNIQ
jgi:hypothetical protein